MTSATAKPRSRASLSVALAAGLAAAGCASFVEVPVEMPLQSKLDVSSFRRVLVAGFVTDPGASDVDLSSETSRLLQNQLRSNARLQVLEPDHPPLHDALQRIEERLRSGAKLAKSEREEYGVETERVLQDAEFWRKLGEEYQTPLIVSGKLSFGEQNRSGFAADERVVRDPSTGQPRLVRGSRYLKRKGYTLSADFLFIDGRSGETLHKEKFTEEVIYSDDQRTSPLASYFELMDRLMPNFLGVITPQKIRGTRVLLQ